MLIPFSVDVPMDRKPWMNCFLILGIIAISVAAFVDSDFFEKVFEIPLGNTALHIGFFHLIGNMIFLFVFGNAVNYKFGQLGYFLLYIACAGMAEVVHILFDGRPSIGASGAVNGIMGAYLVYFFRNDVKVFWLILYRARISTITSGKLLLFYVGWDIFTLVTSRQTGIALWAHIGGFAAGFGIALACLITGLVKTCPDEESLLQILGIRNDEQ